MSNEIKKDIKIDKDKKKMKDKNFFYIILILVSLILAGIIYFFPIDSKTEKKSATKVLSKKTEKRSLVKKEVVDSKIDSKKDVVKNRVVVRDIFNSKYLYVKKDEKKIKKEVSRKIDFKVLGIAISDNGNKSVILNNGMILEEGDKIKDYKIIKINRGQVILKNSVGKIIKLNVWEGE